VKDLVSSDKPASAEPAAPAVIPRSAEAAPVSPASNKTAPPEINLGRLRILAAQITQQRVDALMIALDGCARPMQLQVSVVIGMLRSFFAMQPRDRTKGRSLKKLSDGDVYTLAIAATMWRHIGHGLGGVSDIAGLFFLTLQSREQCRQRSMGSMSAKD
jgi:hypothetical protein